MGGGTYASIQSEPSLVVANNEKQKIGRNRVVPMFPCIFFHSLPLHGASASSDWMKEI